MGSKSSLVSRLLSGLTTWILDVVEASKDEIRIQIREEELQVSQKICSLAALDPNDVEVRFECFKDGSVVPRVEVKVPLTPEEMAKVVSVTDVLIYSGTPNTRGICE